MISMSYEFLEHKADVKFRARGSTLEKMFLSSVEALGEIIRGDIKILEQENKEINVEGKDILGLLHNFLEEFLSQLPGCWPAVLAQKFLDCYQMYLYFLL